MGNEINSIGSNQYTLPQFTGDREADLQTFMKNNKITDRNAAIAYLQSHGPDAGHSARQSQPMPPIFSMQPPPNANFSAQPPGMFPHPMPQPPQTPQPAQMFYPGLELSNTSVISTNAPSITTVSVDVNNSVEKAKNSAAYSKKEIKSFQKQMASWSKEYYKAHKSEYKERFSDKHQREYWLNKDARDYAMSKWKETYPNTECPVDRFK